MIQTWAQHAQMARKLTPVDVQAVTGYTRDQFKALLRELSEWFPAQSARVAREFTPQDMIVFGVVQVLDVRIGIRRKQIGVMLPKLRKALFVPREVARSPSLAITFEPLHIEYLSEKANALEGVLVSLAPIIDRVDAYLGVAQSSIIQDSLRLNGGVIRQRRRRAST